MRAPETRLRPLRRIVCLLYWFSRLFIENWLCNVIFFERLNSYSVFGGRLWLSIGVRVAGGVLLVNVDQRAVGRPRADVVQELGLHFLALYLDAAARLDADDLHLVVVAQLALA